MKRYRSIAAFLNDYQQNPEQTLTVEIMVQDEKDCAAIFNATQLKSLKIINMSEGTEWSDKTGKMHQSTRFSLEGIGNLQMLENLHINGNFEDLPHEIKFLEKLQHLELTYTPRTKLRDELCELPALKSITIFSTQPEFKLNEQIGRLKTLEYFHFSGTEKHKLFIPNALGECKNLKTLIIRSADVGELPDFFSNWQQLKNLWLFKCNLRELPPSLALVHSLEEVLLSDNYQHLPQPLLAHTNMRKLDMKECGLLDLPDEIGVWTKMREFTASKNQLKTIPDSIKNWKILYRFNVSENQLESLPDVFAQSVFSDINEINIAQNQLRALPPSFRELTENIYMFDWGENPFEELPLFFLYWRYNKAHNANSCKYFQVKSVCKHFLPPYPRTFLSNSHELLHAIFELNPDEKHIESLYYIFIKDKQRIKNTNLYTLLLAISSNSPILQKNANAIIEEREAKKWKKTPISRGAQIAILGEFAQGAAVALAQLQQSGWVVSDHLRPETSHVFVGAGVTEAQYQQIPSEMPIGTAFQLKELIEKGAQLHLIEESKQEDGQGQQSVTSLRQLLWSNSSDSTDLALQMMASGGVPKPLWTDLFLMFLYCNTNRFSGTPRNKARELLQLYADKQVMKTVDAFPKDGNLNLRTWTALWKAVKAGFLEWQPIEKAFFDFLYMYPFPKYYWSELSGEELQQAVRRYLALSKGYCASGIYPQNPHIFYDFPAEVKSFKLENSNGSIPPPLFNLEQLEWLWLRGNELSTLPDDITRLKKLAYLDISNNPFSQLPAPLYRMPQLKQIAVNAKVASGGGYDRNIFELKGNAQESDFVLLRLA